jgi:hypothetical protein
MLALRTLLLALSGLGLQPVATWGEVPSTSLRAEGTEWVVETRDGAQLRSADLIGARFRLAGGAEMRIDGVHQVGDASGRRRWAHDLSVQASGETWRPLCGQHSDGTRYAIVLPGRERTDGSLAAEPGEFARSCTTGALAKCLRMGYEPWRHSAGGASLLPAFNACVRMVRADYTGRGLPYTEDGRLIDVHDRYGIQLPDQLPEQTFEAGWDEHGAVCVHHVRVLGKITLEELESSTPRLRGHVGAVCDEAHALKLGALVFNRSAASRAKN